MSVPKFFEFFEAFLNAIQDGELHTAKEVRKKVAEDLQLSSSDLAELVPSGRQTTFGNRINWARTYLNLILRSLKTAYDPFIYWLNRVKIVQMAFGSVNRLLQTSGSLLMNEQTSSLI